MMTKLNRHYVILAVVLSAAAWPPNLPAASGVPRVNPPHSMTHGKSLAQWLAAYWNWYYSGAEPNQSVVDGVQFLPLPAAEQVSGNWTPDDPAVLSGHLDVKLKPGAAFLLPEFAWVRERYAASTGLPDDPPVSDHVFQRSLRVDLTIDGRSVLTDGNTAAFYVPQTAFDPIITYAEPSSSGSIAALWFQGVGFVSPPLSAGTHEIHLHESFIVQPGEAAPFPDGLGLIYDNSWTINVAPK